MFDIGLFEKTYPEMFRQTTPVDLIIGFLILSSIFIIPYLYIRFLEKRFISFMGNRLVPFIKFRLRLKRFIDFLGHILGMRIFGKPG